MVYCLCGNMCVHIYIYMDGMDVFIYSLVCISSLIKFIKQDDIYINLNVKSVKREER